jgi:hypothetical protein
MLSEGGSNLAALYICERVAAGNISDMSWTLSAAEALLEKLKHERIKRKWRWSKMETHAATLASALSRLHQCTAAMMKPIILLQGTKRGRHAEHSAKSQGGETWDPQKTFESRHLRSPRVVGQTMTCQRVDVLQNEPPRLQQVAPSHWQEGTSLP